MNAAALVNQQGALAQVLRRARSVAAAITSTIPRHFYRPPPRPRRPAARRQNASPGPSGRVSAALLGRRPEASSCAPMNANDVCGAIPQPSGAAPCPSWLVHQSWPAHGCCCSRQPLQVSSASSATIAKGQITEPPPPPPPGGCRTRGSLPAAPASRATPDAPAPLPRYPSIATPPRRRHLPLPRHSPEQAAGSGSACSPLRAPACPCRSSSCPRPCSCPRPGPGPPTRQPALG
jgi:hypothetical protein